MPDDALQFPCYALFIDPANALIIKGKDVEPYRDDKGNKNPQRLVPKKIMTTEDINRSVSQPKPCSVSIYQLSGPRVDICLPLSIPTGATRWSLDALCNSLFFKTS
jgi:hypothetical protein